MAKNLKIGEILRQAGIIDEFQVNSALSYQRHWGGRFGESLLRLGYLSEDKLQNYLAQQYDLPHIELFDRKIPDNVLAYIPVEKAREFRVVPVERREVGGALCLVVAMSDPTNLMIRDSLQYLTGCRIKTALASAEAISQAIDRNYGPGVVDQEDLILELEEVAEPAKPVATPVVVTPKVVVAPKAAAPPKADVAPPAAVTPPFAAAHDFDPSAKALKKLEDRFENLIRILLDRGVIDYKDLDELM